MRRAPACVQRANRNEGDIYNSAFVRSEPKLDGIVTARGESCAWKASHGANYNVEILSGLPAGTGEQMREKFRPGS